VFLDLRIVNELRARFSEVRILKSLRLRVRFEVRRRRRRGERQTFELLCELTRIRVAYW
jgi:hypothetical protein